MHPNKLGLSYPKRLLIRKLRLNAKRIIARERHRLRVETEREREREREIKKEREKEREWWL